MCNFKSGLIFKNKVILTPMYDENHSALLRKLNIEDNHMNASKTFVRAELLPKDDNKATDVSEWNFKVDQDIVPDWYEEDAGRYEEDFRNEVKSWMNENFKTIGGELCVKIKEDEIGTYYMTVDSLIESEFGETNNYATSYVREKLISCDFAKALQKEYGDKLIPLKINLFSYDGFDDYGTVEGDILGLRTFDLNRECRKNIPDSDNWEWLSTPNSTPTGCGSGGVRCVDSNGGVNYCWCDGVKDVRPFFVLQNR